jgi:uncharacterized protein YecT (DUF1311 family)
MRRAILIAAVALAPLPALADPAADAEVIERCLGPTGSMEAPDGNACIGVIAQPCQQLPGGETTVGIATCLTQERDAWDVLLNRYYKQLRQTEQEPARGTLRDAQRAWIAWRDADCRFAYEQFLGGSMRQITGAACQRDRTAERVLHLRSFMTFGS